jgi:tetratricopeptide (TPR) repeat protein
MPPPDHSPGRHRSSTGTGTTSCPIRAGLGDAAGSQLDRGLALQEQAVALGRKQPETWSLALALNNLGFSLLQAGDHVRAQAMLEESRALCEAAGEPEGVAAALQGLAEVALVEGDHTRASSSLEQALTLARKIGHVSFIGRFLADLGIVLLHQSDQRRAATLFEEALGFTPRLEDELLTGECLWGLGAVAAGRGQPVRAVRLWGAAAAFGYPMHVRVSTVRVSATRLLEEHLLALTKKTLGRDAFQAEWTRGQAMRREDAIAYALASDGEAP